MLIAIGKIDLNRLKLCVLVCICVSYMVSYMATLLGVSSWHVTAAKRYSLLQ